MTGQKTESTLPEKVEPQKTIKGFLEGDAFNAQVAKALPRHLKPDRFIRIALTALTRNPKLKECDHASFFKCLLDLSQLGIEPDGRRAHLIPFRNNKRDCMECQLIVDYKGLVELAMRSGLVASIHADVVCDNDEFDYDRGEITVHKINFRKPRGQVYASYAICKMKDGTSKCEVLSREEIESVRKRSKAAKNGPWVTDWKEMAKKTAFRRLSKWIQLSPEFRDAVETDDEMSSIGIDVGSQLEHKPSKTLDDLAEKQSTGDAPIDVKATETAPSFQDQVGDFCEANAIDSNEFDGYCSDLEIVIDDKTTDSEYGKILAELKRMCPG